MDGWPQIWQLNPDGTGLHQFAPGKLEGSELSACGNGDTLIFQSWRSGGADIWKWGPNDGDPQQLTNSGGAGTPDGSADRVS